MDAADNIQKLSALQNTVEYLKKKVEGSESKREQITCLLELCNELCLKMQLVWPLPLHILSRTREGIYGQNI